MIENKTAIVTGATGFIGVHLCRELMARGYKVYAVSRPNSRNLYRLRELQAKGLSVIELDLNEIDCKLSFFQGIRKPVFYHLAWDGVVSSKRKDFLGQIINMEHAVRCMKLAEMIGAAKFVATGTVCEKQCDYFDASTLSDAKYYLLAKKWTKEYLSLLATGMGLPFVWCQFYHPVGKYNSREQVIAGTLDSLMREKPKALGSCEDLFNVIDVRDLASALCLMGENNLKNSNYYVGGPDTITLASYIDRICDFAKKKMGKESFIYRDTRKFDGRIMKKEWLDYAPFSSETGYRPQYSFEDTLTYLYEWLEENRDEGY